MDMDERTNAVVGWTTPSDDDTDHAIDNHSNQAMDRQLHGRCSATHMERVMDTCLALRGASLTYLSADFQAISTGFFLMLALAVRARSCVSVSLVRTGLFNIVLSSTYKSGMAPVVSADELEADGMLAFTEERDEVRD